MRTALASLLVLTCGLLLAAPALAGEHVQGSGWELVIPDGFTEALSMEGGGKYDMSSRFSTLPIEGMPDLKAYTAGDPSRPDGVIVITKISLSKAVTTSDELGMKDVSKIRGRLPDNADIQAATVGGYQAIELRFKADDYDGGQTARILAIACGDYVVVIMMMTEDAALPSAKAQWSTMRSSIKIDPPMNKFLLFGLIGFGALGALIVLSRIGSRQVHDIPDHSGHWQGGPNADAAPGMLKDYTPMQTGVRPTVLPSSKPRFEDGPTDDAPSGVPSLTPPALPPNPGAKRVSSNREASPAVTRPPVETPPAPSGLRSTRPASGEWGT
jgi:hypothetical protein